MADKYNIFTDVNLRGNSLEGVNELKVSSGTLEDVSVSSSLTSENTTHLKNNVLINRANPDVTDSIFKVDTDDIVINSNQSTVDIKDKLTEIVGTKDSTITTETHNISKKLSYTVENDSNKVFALDADVENAKSSMSLDTLNIRDNEINFGIKSSDNNNDILNRDNYKVHIVWDSSTKSLVFQVDDEKTE